MLLDTNNILLTLFNITGLEHTNRKGRLKVHCLAQGAFRKRMGFSEHSVDVRRFTIHDASLPEGFDIRGVHRESISNISKITL